MKRANLFLVILVIVFSIMPFLLDSFTVQREIQQEKRQLDRLMVETERLETLVNQKKEVRNYQTIGNTYEINRLFNQLANELEEAYRSSELDTAYEKHREISIIFRGIETVEDQYLFYEALNDYLNGDIAGTKTKLELLTDRFPNSQKMRQAYNLLTTIYIVQNRNREYIELHSRFAGISTAKHNYWLGHAHYNLGDFDRALNVFRSLENDQHFGFRAKIMQAILAFTDNRIDEAIITFENLANEHSVTEPYYDFLLLSLARLYSQIGDEERAFTYFDRYFTLKGGAIPNDQIFEGALLANSAGRSELATSYLLYIVSDPETSEFYDRALTQIALIKAAHEDLASSRELIEDAMGVTTAYTSIMKLQIELLSQYRQKVNDYIYTPGTNKQALKDEIIQIASRLEELKQRHQEIDSIGLNQLELDTISYVVEEYILLLKTVVETDDIAREIAQKPNTEKVESIEEQVSEIDQMREELLTLKLLNNSINENAPQWSKVLRPHQYHARMMMMTEQNQKILADYEAATSIASQLILLQNDMNQLPETGAENQKSLLQQQIESLYQEAEVLLGEIDQNDELIKNLEQELESLLSLRFQLSELKDMVARSYHQKLAERLIRSNRDSLQENEFIYDYSRDIIASFSGKLDDMSQEYNYALLDILFREALKREQEFQDLRMELGDGTASRGGR